MIMWERQTCKQIQLPHVYIILSIQTLLDAETDKVAWWTVLKLKFFIALCNSSFRKSAIIIFDIMGTGKNQSM